MAIDRQVFEAYDIMKNKATSGIEITIDPAKWSNRMKNIITKAVDTGVADCGYETSWFIKRLLETYNLKTQRVNLWEQNLEVDNIKPDKVEEVCAYISALIKMRNSEPDRYTSYAERTFLEHLDNGETPQFVPIPRNFSKADRAKFVNDYLKDKDHDEQNARAEIIGRIRDNMPLTISFKL